MASRSHGRNSQKDKSPKQNGKETLPDEIALRDEILELKRQMMVLKKTNEQNLVKFRKYEDEAKRKDRQIEQLMDPTKNSDIRKILSTKGAAILMNLKDQNNTLIQMILEKDLQIKRLLGEIKTSKLYATSRRTEPYRLEIARLRQLLIKSQELLKEATETPQKRSICIGGTPMLELTSSSDQSSPRELEELRFTIQSLETHMKYSNELLGKKNQEIMILTEQLNSARNAFQCKMCNKKISYDFDLEANKYDWFEPEKISDEALKEDKYSPRSKSGMSDVKLVTVAEETTPKSRRPSSSAELLELFERTMMISKEKKSKTKVPKSAPAGSVRNMEIVEMTPRRGSAPLLLQKSFDRSKTDDSSGNTTQEPFSTEDTGRISLTVSTSEDLDKTSSNRRRSTSLFHDLATGTLDESEIKALPHEDEGNKGKEKWKNAIKKLRKSQRRKRSEAASYKAETSELLSKLNHKRKKAKTSTEASGNDSEIEALETYEFEMMEKRIENGQVEVENLIASAKQNKEDDAVTTSPSKTKLIRQTNIVNSVEKSEDVRKLKVETPKKESSRRSSSSSTTKSTSSHKSENSSKAEARAKRVEAATRRKLTRGKNVTEAPVPLRRTKITDKEITPKPAARQSSKIEENQTDNVLSEDKVEEMAAKLSEPFEQQQQPRPNLDEITIYQVCSKPESVTDTQQIKEEINSISSRFSPEIQKELQSLYDNITSYEEIEKKKAKSLREVYRQSVDSSFDSENSSTTRQEAKVVEVEVEINAAPMQSSESQSQEEPEPDRVVRKEGGESFFDDDDDDDVIFR